MIASPDRGEITRLIQQMPLLRSFIFNIAFHATNISLLTELKHILSFSILRSHRSRSFDKKPSSEVASIHG